MHFQTVVVALFSVATICGAPVTAQSERAQAQELAVLPAPEISPRLTIQAAESAELSGVRSVLERLEKQRQLLNSQEPISLETIASRQRFIYLRNKITDRIQAANLQINSARGNIEASIAQIYELRAYITEQRNRITHRNSQINLFSGGFTKIIGYGIALAPVSAIPTNVLEVFDGGVQASLSALALREQKQEQKLEHGAPPILTAFFADKPSEYYPSMVWRYLNNVPSGGTRSRRQQLIASWTKSKLLETSKTKGPVTVQLLDQRLAMLSDIKAVVTQMHNELMQLADAVVLTYDQDPDL
jgi:hypothetical protein